MLCLSSLPTFLESGSERPSSLLRQNWGAWGTLPVRMLTTAQCTLLPRAQLPTPWQRLERWKLSYFQAKHFRKAPSAAAFVRKAVCSAVARERQQKPVVFTVSRTKIDSDHLPFVSSSPNSCAYGQSTHFSLCGSQHHIAPEPRPAQRPPGISHHREVFIGA